jgi:hypothetical protein
MHRLDDAILLTGWPTPNAMAGGSTSRSGDRKDELLTGGLVQGLTGWVSPTARDHSRGVNPPRPTDTGIPLSQQVAGLTGWATPTAVNHRSVKSNQHGKNARPLQEQAGTTTPSSTAETASPAASPTLNPAFSRWLMAFPETWDAASPNWLAWSRVQELIASAV